MTPPNSPSSQEALESEELEDLEPQKDISGQFPGVRCSVWRRPGAAQRHLRSELRSDLHLIREGSSGLVRTNAPARQSLQD